VATTKRDRLTVNQYPPYWKTGSKMLDPPPIWVSANRKVQSSNTVCGAK